MNFLLTLYILYADDLVLSMHNTLICVLVSLINNDIEPKTHKIPLLLRYGYFYFISKKNNRTFGNSDYTIAH